MSQAVKRKASIQDFLAGKVKLFEENYKIKYKCKYSMNGKKERAQICFETGEIFVNGQVVRRCHVC